MRLAIGRSRCNVDARILSVSAEVQVVPFSENKDEAKVLSKFAELVEVRVFEVHVAEASKLHLFKTVDDLWNPHVGHNALAQAAWEFAKDVEGEGQSKFLSYHVLVKERAGKDDVSLDLCWIQNKQ